MNKFLKYGVATMCVFAGAAAQGMIGMNLYNAFLTQSAVRSKADLAATQVDKGTVKATAKEGRGLYDLIVTGNTALFGEYDDLNDCAKRILDAAITDLYQNQDGKSAIWQEFLAAAPDLGLLTSAERIVVWLNCLGKQAEKYVTFCQGRPRVKSKEDAYGKTDKRAWQLCGEMPKAVATTLDALIGTGTTHAGPYGGQAAKDLAERLREQRVDLDNMAFQGAKLFADTSEGAETLEQNTLNAMNAGNKDEAQERWARLYLWYTSEMLTDGHFTNSEQMYYFTKFGKGGGIGQAAGQTQGQAPNMSTKEQKKLEALEAWIDDMGYYYDQVGNRVMQADW